MNQEQQIERLEQEVQILKNQIQATLLEIQEHLLTHTYPALRSDVAEHPEPEPALPASRSKVEWVAEPHSQQPAQSPRMQSIPAAKLETREWPKPSWDDSPEPPAVRKVASLTDLMAHEDDEPTPAVTRQAAKLSSPTLRPNTVSEPVREQRGASTGPFPIAPVEDPPHIVEPDQALLELLEDWTHKRVKDMGAHQARQLIWDYADEGRFNVNVRDALLRLVSINEMESGNGHRPDSRELDAYFDDEGENKAVLQGVVLRLIAGVQNAGAGFSRRKKDG